MEYGKQSTATTYTFGPILDADGAAVTTVVVGDLKASKNGNAFAALNGSATLTHYSAGHYYLALTTTDTNTIGSLTIILDDDPNAAQPLRIQVLAPNVYDGMFGSAAASTGVPANVVAIDSQVTSGNNATLNLKQLNIQNNAGTALLCASSGSNGHGASFSGNGTGEGISATGGATGHGIEAIGGATSGSGLNATAQGGGSGIIGTGVGGNAGIRANGGATGAGLQANGGTSGAGIAATGGSTNQNGITATGGGSGAGMRLTPGNTGNGLRISGGVDAGAGLLITSANGDPAGHFLGTASVGLQVEATSGGGNAAFYVTNDDGTGFQVEGGGNFAGVTFVGGSGGLNGHGIHLQRGHVNADDLFLSSSDAPTLMTAFFTNNSGKVYADAVAGSVVKEIALGTPGGSGGSVNDIAGAVWDELLAGHVASGSAGQRVGRLPNADAGTANGLIILGDNTAGLSIVPTTGEAVVLQSIDDNALALIGGVSGLRVQGGLTDPACYIGSSLGNSHALYLDGVGTGHDLFLASTKASTLAATLFTNDSGQTYATSVAGSVVKEIADNAALFSGNVDGFTLEETLRLCLAALAGKISGAGTTNITIRAADDSKNRIVAVVDADGNRTTVTLDAT